MSFIDLVKSGISSKNFARFVLAIAWSAFTMFFFIFLLTHEVVASAQHYISNLQGFLEGTCCALILNFYFSSSQSSADKDAAMNDTMKSLTSPPDNSKSVTVTETKTG